MTIRRYQESDRAALERLENQKDFAYPSPDSPLLETCWVACDEHGRPVMSIEAHRTAELYFRMSKDVPHFAAIHAGHELLRNIFEDLRYASFNEADGYLSPRIENNFGRHLQRHFGAIRNWASFKFRF